MAYADSDLRPGIRDIFEEAGRLPAGRTAWHADGHEYMRELGVGHRAPRTRAPRSRIERATSVVVAVGVVEIDACPVCGAAGTFKVGCWRVYHPGRGTSYCRVIPP